MIVEDRFGNGIQCDSADDAQACDGFAQEILSHGKLASAILPRADAGSSCALLQAQAAALFLFLQTADGHQRATPYIEAARRAAPQASRREQLFVQAVEHWWKQDVDAALACHRQILDIAPRDLLNLKLAQIHFINRGDSEAMLDMVLPGLDAAQDVGYAWGLAAYALEQCQRFAEAEAAGRRAVALNLDDPWAQHAVAHVLEMQGRTGEKFAWLEEMNPSWERCSSFMYTHNWWHYALAYIDADMPEAALQIFDARVWGVRKGHVQDQINAIALLARLEFVGMDIGDRWRDVGDHVAARVDDHINGFLDLHFLYGLLRAGRDAEAQQLVQGMWRQGASLTGDARTLWHKTTLTIANAIIAYLKGDHDGAVRQFQAVRDHLHRIGGSNAQRDLFEQLYLLALLGSSASHLAQTLSGQRVERRSAVGWEQRLHATAVRQSR